MARRREAPAYTLRVTHRGRTIEIGPFRSEEALRSEARAYKEKGAEVRMLRGDTSERPARRDRDDDYDEPRRRRGRYDEDVDEYDELEDEEPDRPPRDTHPWFKDLFTR